MTRSQLHDQAAVLAEPLAHNTWRVCDTGELDIVESTMGYISELGGTYEVRVLHSPQRHAFVRTFKEAMECFEAVAS